MQLRRENETPKVHFDVLSFGNLIGLLPLVACALLRLFCWIGSRTTNVDDLFKKIKPEWTPCIAVRAESNMCIA